MKYIDIDMRRTQFKELIEKWDRLLIDFENVMTTEDLPYIYKERTSVGLLAAAATKKGYIVLEEYGTEKQHKGQTRAGRADLWLYKKDKSIDISLEAKYKEISWSSKKVIEVVKPILKKAVSDVNEVRPSEGAKYSLGVVFVRPYNANPDSYNPDDFWDQFGDKSSLGADFCAMHLCKYEIWSEQKYNKGYPGICIAGKFSD